MKIAKSVNRLGTEAVYNIFAKTKQLAKEGKQINIKHKKKIFFINLNLILFFSKLNFFKL